MKAPSDSTLQSWWREAVKAVHGDQCVMCGAEPVECHHIIKRRYKVLRNDWRNGLPLCARCHSCADTIAGREELMCHVVDVDYLRRMEQWTYKDYLVMHHLTDSEFKKNELDELKQVAREPHEAWLTWVSRR